MFGASATKLYAVPKTLEQAHLLMSYDPERYLVGFDWIRERVAALAPKRVLEVGTGTGVCSAIWPRTFLTLPTVKSTPRLRTKGSTSSLATT